MKQEPISYRADNALAARCQPAVSPLSVRFEEADFLFGRVY